MSKVKVLCIGDIHGTDHWKTHIKAFKQVDKVVFLGDYF